jgi:hypothetical protein
MERVKGIEPSSQLSPIPPKPFGSGNFYMSCAGNDINSNGLLNQVNNS